MESNNALHERDAKREKEEEKLVKMKQISWRTKISEKEVNWCDIKGSTWRNENSKGNSGSGSDSKAVLDQFSDGIVEMEGFKQILHTSFAETVSKERDIQQDLN